MARRRIMKDADANDTGNLQRFADRLSERSVRGRLTNTNSSPQGRYRSGHPIPPEVWTAFMQSRRWEDIPGIFMPLYADGDIKGSVEEMEKRTPLLTEKDPVFFGLNLICAEKGFADEVNKNEMMRILCRETVRWGLPVIDFVLLDDALHLILCMGSRRGEPEHLSGRERVQEKRQGIVRDWSKERWHTYTLNQFALSLERSYQEYYAQRMELPCTFMTQDLLCQFQNPLQTLNACCRMHTLPVSLGLVNDIKLYWFSGYNTVRGKFAWNFMDPTQLLQTLSDRPNKAVRQYLNAHRAFLAGMKQEYGDVSEQR